MWPLLRPWLVLSTLAVAASASDSLYILEQQTHETTLEHKHISADAARLILASRLGVETYHAAGAISESDIDRLARHGKQHSLFDSNRSAPERVAAVLMTSTWKPSGSSSFTKLEITRAPALERTEELFGALVLQKVAQLSHNEALDPRHSALAGSTPQAVAEELQKGATTMSGRDTTSYRVLSSREDLEDSLADFQRQGYTVLVLVSGINARSSIGYGDYTIPTSSPRPRHSKRDTAASDRLAPRIDMLFDQHSPMDVDQQNSTAASFSSSSSSSSSQPLSSQEHPSNDNDTLPNLRGIIPRCHATKHSCETATRNCTGHGSCEKIYTHYDKVGQEGKGEPCFACSCVDTVTIIGGGGGGEEGSRRVTVWGGPACQKKNVVTPFWLLAGFSVVALFVVGWAVGLIWEMGEEELPSVIGAGVSGVARK